MKKPRTKKHRPFIPSIPMMNETRDALALDLRMAIEVLIAAPSVEAYNALSLKFITLGRVVGRQEFMERAKRAMLDVAARFERVGKMGASAAEAAVLRDTARLMEAAMALVSVTKMAHAEMRTHRLFVQGEAA